MTTKGPNAELKFAKINQMKGSLKGILPIKQEFEDYSASSLSTETEKSFGSALASMSPGDIIEYGANDDYEYMFNADVKMDLLPGPFLNLVSH